MKYRKMGKLNWKVSALGFGAMRLPTKKIDEKEKIIVQYVWNQPGVSVVLSGMSNMEQVRENIASAEQSGIETLNEEELNFIEELRDAFDEKIAIKCTYCKYCLPCPTGIDIPGNLHLYNRYNWGGPNTFIINQYKWKAKDEEGLKENPNNGRATLCVECGECLDKCPQNIDIPTELTRVADVYENLIE